MLSCCCDEHATRVALMSFDWLDAVVDAMKSLVEQKSVEIRTQDKETFEMYVAPRL